MLVTVCCTAASALCIAVCCSPSISAKFELFTRGVQLAIFRTGLQAACGGPFPVLKSSQKKSGLVAPQPAKRGVFGSAAAGHPAAAQN
jgi:hypothetical protein